MLFSKEKNRLVCKNGCETIWIESWGDNSLRVRMTADSQMDTNDWALTIEQKECNPKITIEEIEVVEPWYKGEERESHKQKFNIASITNGKITAKVNFEGWISFENEKGEVILEEYWRNRIRIDRYAVPINVPARELKAVPGMSDYRLSLRFEAYEGEQIFGMGQYQEGNLDKKGATLELAQRNTQASVPFFVSSRGYGFLWNNPAIGNVSFGTNKTEWKVESTKKLDYFITVEDTPDKIIKQYAKATGTVPMMPEYGMGFWQCKLRYRNQEELLHVVREHKRRGLPMDVVVIDFFHWTKQGDFKFDPVDWPNPEEMIRELKELGVELMVSVWPTVDSRSENYGKMAEQGYLLKYDRGVSITMNWMGETSFFDATHPGAREYVWERCKENYFDKGVNIFWLDEAEPEYGPYDFDIYRYYQGSALQVSNIYPAMYAKAFYDGMVKEGMDKVLNLVRCAWAGSQRYGALVWSGDVYSSFRAMREQLQAGLNMGIAGIPWWTTDIGGFLGGDIHDDNFKELLVRWFEWGVFCPVFRLHGERPPFYPLEEEFRDGTRMFSSGQDNEVWSFGEEIYEIFKKYLFLREKLRPYIRNLMKEAHENGAPVMRTMFYEFPEDDTCWKLTNQYMFGSELLVAPIMEEKVHEREVYLPKGIKWVESATRKVYEGGQTIKVDAPIDMIPIFIKEGSDVEVYGEN
ncbi:glycoside hydrolase family 31 protein [Anaeromicropila herbilytica]|uniref:Glycosyl hydrolase n=1 Tax=Anaeromicropila herbilytica TaxID=2785025 RepID=A0A7R7EJT8_9FIRM|nr:glycoside hydrolase family 31 protein [Anaeromicropila herbilytica]BCN30161.1 glycosyl hydrolase [Anaeromicropila herbilytica]